MNPPFSSEISNLEKESEIAVQIAAVLRGIRFGSIEIVVHDGRIVQIDKHEKFRINPPPAKVN